MVDFAEIYGIDSPLASGVGMGPTWGQAVDVGITGILPGRNRTPDYGTRPVSAGVSVANRGGPVILSDAPQALAAQAVGGTVAEAAVIGNLLYSGAQAVAGLPWGEYSFEDILPGGAPFKFPDLPTGAAIAKHWWTGTALFAIDDLGKRWVFLKKQDRWKRVSTRSAFHVGRNPTSKNVRALGRAMAHHKKTAKIYGKLFPKKKAGSKHGHGCKCPRCM